MKNLVKKSLIISGRNNGQTSIVMVGNHGDEPCGVNALNQILPTLQIESGKVIFVLGNPIAFEDNSRFIEYNLNRLFCESSFYSEEVQNSYEYKRAQELKSILDQGTALLDIHSTKNQSDPFIVCEENANKIVQHFPSDFKRVVYGFDAIEPGATDGYMLSKGKIGITIECGQHEDPKTTDIAKNAIYSFLKSRGHMNFRSLSFARHKKREVVQMNFIYYSKTDSFTLSRKFYDFEPINKGSLIGKDGNEKIFAPCDCMIVFAHDCNKAESEAFLLGNKVP